MNHLLRLIIIFCVFLPSAIFAQSQVANIGLIKGIWFSHSKFYTGDTIRIYTALQNNSGYDVDGTIEFFDNGKSLGAKPFSALDNRIIESWVDTTVSSGKHQYSIQITDAQKNKLGEAVTPITPQSSSSEAVVVVERDTDGDDIPDSEDDDDDNDGYSDAEENKSGSDPLNNKDVPVKIKEEVKVPVVDSEESTTLKNLEDIVNIILSKDNVPTDNNNSNENQTPVQLTTDDYVRQSPELIQKLVKEKKTLSSIIAAITSTQSKGQEIITLQTDRLNQKENIDIEKGQKDTLKKEDGSGGTSELKTGDAKQENKTTFGNVLSNVYKGFLAFLAWLFSIWWFWLVFPFFLIYLLIRVLFRIFKNR